MFQIVFIQKNTQLIIQNKEQISDAELDDDAINIVLTTLNKLD